MPRGISSELGLLAGVLIAVASCRPTTIVERQIVSGPHAVGCLPPKCGDPRDVVSVTYLGISGILVEHDGHVLLTAPFFSNPPFAARGRNTFRWLATGPRLTPDSMVIERLLPKSADHASAILVGHGHYDHLMDVAYIATHRAKSAVIFGGPSIRHMLMGDSTLRSNADRLAVIPLARAGKVSRDGDWYYSPDSAFRFMALIAGHAPNYLIGRWGFLYADGAVPSDMDSLPHTAAEWKMGEPYSYLIDVLSRATHHPVFRIYFQDAPSQPPLGFPSTSLAASRPIDLAIICAATSSNVSAAPDSLLRVLKPAAVLVTHWESFFRSRLLPQALSHATDLRALSHSLRRSLPAGTGWVMPIPLQTVRFSAADHT